MIRKSIKVVGALIALGAVGCSTTTTSKPAGVASAGCSQLGNASEAAAPQLNQVYASREVQEQVFQARALQPTRTSGAELYLHATPGTTSEYLERVFTCHAAEGQAVGSNDPFHPSAGYVSSVNVRKAGAGFAVRVTGNDSATAKEIWRRADALAGGSVEVEQVAGRSAQNAL